MLALLALKLKKMKSNFIIVIIKSIIRAIAFGVLGLSLQYFFLFR